MSERNLGELILFPKTVDYYQVELTKLLEKEAYTEAIRLLEFLIECRTDDERVNQEWTALLGWLQAEFSGGGLGHGTSPPSDCEAEDDGEEGEDELRRRAIASRLSQDRHYGKRLLETLRSASVDKQMIALDQLVYIEEQGVDETLLGRLHNTALHPFVSFKLLQTLSRRGISGEATFGKLGEIVTVDIEKTPLTPEQFPSQMLDISDRLQQVADQEDPTLSGFGRETWLEFLMMIYGTELYREMSEASGQEADIWASALHVFVAEMVYGRRDDAVAREHYGITEPLLKSWERAYLSLEKILRDDAGFNV